MLMRVLWVPFFVPVKTTLPTSHYTTMPVSEFVAAFMGHGSSEVKRARAPCILRNRHVRALSSASPINLKPKRSPMYFLCNMKFTMQYK